MQIRYHYKNKSCDQSNNNQSISLVMGWSKCKLQLHTCQNIEKIKKWKLFKRKTFVFFKLNPFRKLKRLGSIFDYPPPLIPPSSKMNNRIRKHLTDFKTPPTPSPMDVINVWFLSKKSGYIIFIIYVKFS